MNDYLTFITRNDPQTGLMQPAEGKRKVFISYKHSDELDLPLCSQLADFILEELDVAVWYDRQLTGGSEYDSEIRQVIRSADAFVLLLTKNILSSDYIIYKEIPYAIENKVAIIPVIAGIERDDLSKVEALVGKIHMPKWFYSPQVSMPVFELENKKSLIEGLKLCIANKDLLENCRLFYEKGLNSVSLKYLTPEQMFLKAYGYLFGIEGGSDKSIGVKLMESIMNVYGADDEIVLLKNEVASELVKHFYKSNQPEMMFAYLTPELLESSNDIYGLTFKVFREGWNFDYISNNTDLSVLMFKAIYLKLFGEYPVLDRLNDNFEKYEYKEFKDHKNTSEEPHIGVLSTPYGIAYFQKSDKDPHEVDLVFNGLLLSVNDIRTFDPAFLFLAYDEKRSLLISMYSDFNHYSVDSYICVDVYKMDGNGIKNYCYSEEFRGLRQLPYSPHTFDIY